MDLGYRLENKSVNKFSSDKDALKRLENICEFVKYVRELN